MQLPRKSPRSTSPYTGHRGPATHRPGSNAFRSNWRFTTPNRVISGTARSGITITLLCPKITSRIGCARRRLCCKVGMRSYLSTTFRTDLCSKRLQAAGFNSRLSEHVCETLSDGRRRRPFSIESSGSSECLLYSTRDNMSRGAIEGGRSSSPMIRRFK